MNQLLTPRIDLECRQCRQSLRGQPLAGLCPRCGGKIADSYAATLGGRAPTGWLRSVSVGGYIVMLGYLITPCAWPIATTLSAQGSLRQTTFHTHSSGELKTPTSYPAFQPTSIPTMPPARPPKAPTFPAEPFPDSPGPAAPENRTSNAQRPATAPAQTQPASSPDLARVEAILSRAFPDPHPITPIGLAPSTAPAVRRGSHPTADPAAQLTTPATTSTTVNLGSPIPAATLITLWTALTAAGVFLVTRPLPDDSAAARRTCGVARLASHAPLGGVFVLFAPDSGALQVLQWLALLVFFFGWPVYWLRVAHLLREIPLPTAARRLRLAVIMLFITAGMVSLFIILPPLLPGALSTAILWPLVALVSLLCIPTLLALLYALFKQVELSTALRAALAARNAV